MPGKVHRGTERHLMMPVPFGGLRKDIHAACARLELSLQITVSAAQTPPISGPEAGGELASVSLSFEHVLKRIRCEDVARVREVQWPGFDTAEMIVVIVKKRQVQREVFSGLDAVAKLVGQQHF